MKNLFYLIILSVFVISCKPTTHIITSKKEAIKQNLYDTNLERRIAVLENKAKEQNVQFQKVQILEAPSIGDNKYAEIELKGSSEDIIIASNNPETFSNGLIAVAEQNLGSPYVTGGTSKRGFDCSGFVLTAYKFFNISLPRTANDMSRAGRVLDKNEYRKGDLIFFKTNGKTVINHVGMVVDATEDNITFIHASTSKGVIISNTKETYYGKAFAQVNRIVE